MVPSKKKLRRLKLRGRVAGGEAVWGGRLVGKGGEKEKKIREQSVRHFRCLASWRADPRGQEAELGERGVLYYPQQEESEDFDTVQDRWREGDSV